MVKRRSKGRLLRFLFLGIVLVLLALPGLILLRQLVQDKLKERVRSLLLLFVEENELGKLTYEKLEIRLPFPSSVTLKNVRLSIEEQEEPLLEASSVKLKFSLWEIISKRSPIALVVQVDSPKVALHYLGGGKFSITRLVERILKKRRKPTRLTRLTVLSENLGLTIFFGDKTSEDLDAFLRPRLVPAKSALTDALSSLSSSYGVNFNQGFRQAIDEFFGDSVSLLPKEALEISGDSTFRYSKSASRLSLNIVAKAPANARVDAEIDLDSGDFRVKASTSNFSPLIIPIRFPQLLNGFFASAKLQVQEVELLKNDAGFRTSFNLRLSQASLRPFLGKDIRLAAFSLFQQGNRLEVVAGLEYENSKLRLNANRGKEWSLKINASSFPLTPFVSAINGFQADSISGEVSFNTNPKRKRGSANLLLSSIRYGGDTIFSVLSLRGSWEESLRLLLKGFKKSRLLLSLNLSGAPNDLLFDLSYSLSRQDIALLTLINIPVRQIKASSGVVTGRATLSPFSLSMQVRKFSASTSYGTILVSQASARADEDSWEVLLSKGEISLVQNLVHRFSYPKVLNFSGEVSLRERRTQPRLSSRLEVLGRSADISAILKASGSGKVSSLPLSFVLTGLLFQKPIFASGSALATNDSLKEISLTGDLGSSSFKVFGEVPYQEQINLALQLTDLAVPVHLSSLTFVPRLSLFVRVRGYLNSPTITARLEGKELLVPLKFNGRKKYVPINDLRLPLTANKDSVLLHQGSFFLRGIPFLVEGSSKEGELNLRFYSSVFNPSYIFADLIGAQPLSWRGSGKLEGNILWRKSGLNYHLTFRQEGGKWEDEEIHSAFVSLSGDDESLKVSRSIFRLGDGVAKVDGRLCFSRGKACKLVFFFHDFPVGPLAHAFKTKLTADLSGALQGDLELGGTVQDFSLSGDLSLINASVLYTKMEKISLKFHEEKKGIRVQELVAYSENSYLQGSGFWGEDPRDTLISLEVPLLDISLLSPLLPSFLSPISGDIGANLVVKQRASGRPEIVGSFQSAGKELTVAGVTFERVEGRLGYLNGVISLPRVVLRIGESALELEGDIPVTSNGNGMELKLLASKLRAGYLSNVLKTFGIKTDGEVSTNLLLSGSFNSPKVSGDVTCSLKDFSYRDILSFPRIDTKLEFDKDLVSILPSRIYAFVAPADDKLSSYAEIVGNLSLPRSKTELPSKVDVAISLGNLRSASFKNYFKGALDGQVRLLKNQQDEPLRVAGNVTMRSGSEIRIVPVSLGETFPLFRKVALDLGFKAEKASRLRYPAAALEVDFYGELQIGGDLSNPVINGELSAPSGSMVIYHHIIRLAEPARISFSPGAGLVPFISGLASVELPGALASSGIAPSVGLNSTAQPGLSPEISDLTIYFHLNNLLTEEALNAIQLSSSPPLPQETIRRYLVGDMPGQITRSALGSLVEAEAMLFSASRLSRFLEESLEFKRFELRAISTREGTPLYLNLEKELTPSLSLRYLKTFFTVLDAREELALRYLILKSPRYRSTLELLLRRRSELQEEWGANFELTTKF